MSFHYCPRCNYTLSVNEVRVISTTSSYYHCTKCGTQYETYDQELTHDEHNGLNKSLFLTEDTDKGVFL